MGARRHSIMRSDQPPPHPMLHQAALQLPRSSPSPVRSPSLSQPTFGSDGHPRRGASITRATHHHQAMTMPWPLDHLEPGVQRQARQQDASALGLVDEKPTGSAADHRAPAGKTADLGSSALAQPREELTHLLEKLEGTDYASLPAWKKDALSLVRSVVSDAESQLRAIGAQLDASLAESAVKPAVRRPARIATPATSALAEQQKAPKKRPTPATSEAPTATKRSKIDHESLPAESDNGDEKQSARLTSTEIKELRAKRGELIAWLKSEKGYTALSWLRAQIKKHEATPDHPWMPKWKKTEKGLSAAISKAEAQLWAIREQLLAHERAVPAPAVKPKPAVSKFAAPLRQSSPTRDVKPKSKPSAPPKPAPKPISRPTPSTSKPKVAPKVAFDSEEDADMEDTRSSSSENEKEAFVLASTKHRVSARAPAKSQPKRKDRDVSDDDEDYSPVAAQKKVPRGASTATAAVAAVKSKAAEKSKLRSKPAAVQADSEVDEQKHTEPEDAFSFTQSRPMAPQRQPTHLQALFRSGTPIRAPSTIKPSRAPSAAARKPTAAPSRIVPVAAKSTSAKKQTVIEPPPPAADDPWTDFGQPDTKLSLKAGISNKRQKNK